MIKNNLIYLLVFLLGVQYAWNDKLIKSETKLNKEINRLRSEEHMEYRQMIKGWVPLKFNFPEIKNYKNRINK